MTRRLLINADDFGLTPGINRAIAELHQAGALGSATLMANGAAFADAVQVAAQNKGLGVGCHVVLTDGSPTLPASSVRSLLSRDPASFRPSLISFIAAVLLGRVRESEVALEAEAQIRRLQQAGLVVTHVDTHKHTHVLPLVARGVLTAMERTGVRAIRNPFEPAWSLRLGPGTRLRRLQVLVAGRLRRGFERLPAVRDGRVRTTEGTIGVSATGHLNGDVLRTMMDVMPAGTWELVCHPGYNDTALGKITTRLRATREVERAALLEEFGRKTGGAGITSKRCDPVELIHFADLVARHSGAVEQADGIL